MFTFTKNTAITNKAATNNVAKHEGVVFEEKTGL